MPNFNFGFEASKAPRGYIFISYAHRDAAVVAQFAYALRSMGFEIWYDNGITPLENFKETIFNKIRNCGCFLAFISSNYAKSHNCITETGYATAAKIERLPIFIEKMDSLPDVLQYDILNVNYLNAYEYSNFPEVIDIIATRLSKILMGEAREWSAWNDKRVKTDISLSPAQDECTRKVKDAYVWLEHFRATNNWNDLKTARDSFEEISRNYSSDHRGWVGLIECVGEWRLNSDTYLNNCEYSKETIENTITNYWSFISPEHRTAENESKKVNAVKAVCRQEIRCLKNALTEVPKKENADEQDSIVKKVQEHLSRLIDMPELKTGVYSDIRMEANELMTDFNKIAGEVSINVEAQRNAEKAKKIADDIAASIEETEKLKEENRAIDKKLTKASHIKRVQNIKILVWIIMVVWIIVIGYVFARTIQYNGWLFVSADSNGNERFYPDYLTRMYWNMAGHYSNVQEVGFVKSLMSLAFPVIPIVFLFWYGILGDDPFDDIVGTVQLLLYSVIGSVIGGLVIYLIPVLYYFAALIIIILSYGENGESGLKYHIDVRRSASDEIKSLKSAIENNKTRIKELKEKIQ